jgi:hypothetical protein
VQKTKYILQKSTNKIKQLAIQLPSDGFFKSSKTEVQTNRILGLVCFCFSADFFNQKAKKQKVETNGKLFNWLLKR